MCFFVKLALRVTSVIYATPQSSGNLRRKLSSDWLSAGSNVVASESMIFVFEFIAKPFAYSSKRNFLSAFFRSLSCVDCSFCRTASLTAANRVVIFINPPLLSWPFKEIAPKRSKNGHEDGHFTTYCVKLETASGSISDDPLWRIHFWEYLMVSITAWTI